MGRSLPCGFHDMALLADIYYLAILRAAKERKVSLVPPVCVCLSLGSERGEGSKGRKRKDFISFQIRRAKLGEKCIRQRCTSLTSALALGCICCSTAGVEREGTQKGGTQKPCPWRLVSLSMVR